ncbi:MAG: multiprotein bridging factor aMBF1 [archaeon]
MSCDICGQEILRRPAKIVVEGAILEVCGECARLGKPYVPPARSWVPHPQIPTRRVESGRSSPRRNSASLPRTYEELDLVERFGDKIRKARERAGITQTELAAKVKERLSIIQKIELEKMSPNTDLCMALEHVLRVKLLTPRAEIPTGTLKVSQTAEPTLGDVVKLKRKN